MLAVIKENEGSGFKVKEIEIPIPKEEEVLIKVKVVGICGSDIPILKGTRKVTIPLIPGHEFSGEIVEVGKDVKGFEVGDRVTASIVRSCGDCYYCKNGMESLCDHIIETGIHVNGAYAQYIAVPFKVLKRLPKNMSFEQGASIDPLASVYRPIKKARVRAKDSVIIVGPGPIGLYAVQLAKIEGVKMITTIGVKGDEERLKLAKELGSDHIINLGELDVEDIVQINKKLDNIQEADVIIYATGNPQMFNLCLDLISKGGIIIVVGIPQALSKVDLARIVRKEIRIEGSLCYTFNDFLESIKLVESGIVNTDLIVSNHFKLSEIDKALKQIEERKAIKVLLYP